MGKFEGVYRLESDSASEVVNVAKTSKLVCRNGYSEWDGVKTVTEWIVTFEDGHKAKGETRVKAFMSAVKVIRYKNNLGRRNNPKFTFKKL